MNRRITVQNWRLPRNSVRFIVYSPEWWLEFYYRGGLDRKKDAEVRKILGLFKPTTSDSGIWMMGKHKGERDFGFAFRSSKSAERALIAASKLKYLKGIQIRICSITCDWKKWRRVSRIKAGVKK